LNPEALPELRAASPCSRNAVCSSLLPRRRLLIAGRLPLVPGRWSPVAGHWPLSAASWSLIS